MRLHPLKRIFNLIAIVLLSASLLSATGCASSRRKKARKEAEEKIRQEEMEVSKTRRGLSVDETVTFVFKADNAWHPAPFWAGKGDLLEVTLPSDSPFEGRSPVQFRISTMRQIISHQSQFMVTEPGSFIFRTPPLNQTESVEVCTVTIHRIK